MLLRAEGSARPLFPQWSHHVYPQFLPGSHPNASQHQHNYSRHRHTYTKHHYNLNNNHHSHHHNHKVDHRYHRNSITSHAGNLVHSSEAFPCWMLLYLDKNVFGCRCVLCLAFLFALLLSNCTFCFLYISVWDSTYFCCWLF